MVLPRRNGLHCKFLKNSASIVLEICGVPISPKLPDTGKYLLGSRSGEGQAWCKFWLEMRKAQRRPCDSRRFKWKIPLTDCAVQIDGLGTRPSIWKTLHFLFPGPRALSFWIISVSLNLTRTSISALCRDQVFKNNHSLRQKKADDSVRGWDSAPRRERSVLSPRSCHQKLSTSRLQFSTDKTVRQLRAVHGISLGNCCIPYVTVHLSNIYLLNV